MTLTEFALVWLVVVALWLWSLGVRPGVLLD